MLGFLATVLIVNVVFEAGGQRFSEFPHLGLRELEPESDFERPSAFLAGLNH